MRPVTIIAAIVVATMLVAIPLFHNAFLTAHVHAHFDLCDLRHEP